VHDSVKDTVGQRGISYLFVPRETGNGCDQPVLPRMNGLVYTYRK
jgi:hypothetical protein